MSLFFVSSQFIWRDLAIALEAAFEESALQKYRSRPSEVFCKKEVFQNFTKLTEKHLCQSHFNNKVRG